MLPCPTSVPPSFFDIVYTRRKNDIATNLSLVVSSGLGNLLPQVPILHEEVYMVLPPGFKIPGSEEKVCKLRKALYGLKQSPQAWFERFRGNLTKVGYIQSQADHTLFFKHSFKGTTIVIVYVDDIVVT